MDTFFFFTAHIANKNNEENNEGNKAQIQTQREKAFFVSVSIFKGKMTDTFAAVGFIQQLGCSTKIAMELETYLSLTVLLLLAPSEILARSLGFVLWDITDTSLGKTQYKN